MEFEPTTSAGERPQTYALDRAAIGTGTALYILVFVFLDIAREDNRLWSEL